MSFIQYLWVRPQVVLKNFLMDDDTYEQRKYFCEKDWPKEMQPKKLNVLAYRADRRRRKLAGQLNFNL